MSLSKFKLQTTPLVSAKGLLTYNLMHGITFMKKYIDNEHKTIVAKYDLHHKSEDEASSLSLKKTKSANKLCLLQ
jgi:hypothetical protein